MDYLGFFTVYLQVVPGLLFTAVLLANCPFLALLSTLLVPLAI